jgi:hypothetical protein
VILNSFQRLIQLIHLTFHILNDQINIVPLAYFRKLALRTEELADFGIDGVASEKLYSFVLQFNQFCFAAKKELNQGFILHNVYYLCFLPIAFFVFHVHPLTFMELSILAAEYI